MRQLEQREYAENSIESEVFNPSTIELFEALNNDKNCISTFRDDVKQMIGRLHLPNPKFVAQLKKYLKDKEKDNENSISINDYLKRADIIDFQETLDNRSKIENEELQEEMMELSKSCLIILDLLEEDKGEENIKIKKEKKQEIHEINKYRDEPDEDEDELYEKYGYRKAG